MAECWAGGMELGGGFSLRSFVNPPPSLPLLAPLPFACRACVVCLGAWGASLGGAAFTSLLRGNSSFDPGPWQRCRTKDRQGCIMPSSCGAGNAL